MPMEEPPMFSPHDSPAVNDWFRRLDAAWRRLPAEERISQREEIQQHLEALVAAKAAQGQPTEVAWDSALMQFGDPTQIGRKICQEWQQSRTGFRADIRAIMFGASLTLVSRLVLQLLWAFWFDKLYNENNGLYTHGHGLVGLALVVSRVVGYGGSALIPLAIGRKYPSQAIKSAFYPYVLWDLWTLGPLAVSLTRQTGPVDHSQWTLLTYIISSMPLWTAGHLTLAYLASVTRRGWYRPSLDDFKLTLPRKRPQTSR